MKRLIVIIISALLIMQTALSSVVLAENTPWVTVNGKRIFLSENPVAVNGTWLFPFKELMGKLGFFVGFDEQRNAYVGMINGAEAEVPVTGNMACYDKVRIELDNPLQGIDGDVLTELRFIEMLYGIECTFDGNKVDFKTEIFKTDGSQEKAENFDADAYLSSIMPKSVNISEDSLFKAAVSDPKLISMRVVDVENAPGFTRAVEVENLTEPRLYYSAQITIPIETSVSAGDVLYLSFWAQKVKCVDESGFATFNTTYEAIDSTWSKYHNVTEDSLSEEWTKYTYPFVVTANLNGGGAQLGFRIGFRLQTLRFGGVKVLNYGKKADISLIAPEKIMKTTYYGREEGALWREEAFRRIEKYRKNDMKITVVNKDGNPVPGAHVSAKMTKSEFLWGNAANHQKCFEGSRNSIYYQNIQANKFNSLTCETGMKSGGYRAENCVSAVNFVRDNDLYFRAHAIFWDRQDLWPAELSDNPTVEEVKEACYKFASKLAFFFKDSVNEIDVLNEPLNNDVIRSKYGFDFLADIFKMSQALFPDARLFLNETGITGAETNRISVEKLRGIVDSLLEAGAPLQGIGIQDHAGGFVYPQEFYNAIDYIAENLDYIAITEYDYLSKLPNTVDALKIEADYLRDSIILAYSHPKMTSFTMWGFTDFGHWRANAPLYFSSYNPKPALKFWDEYVWGEWFTDAEVVTDETGVAVIRGHRGNYDITVDVNGKSEKTTLVLTKDGENTVKAVVGDSGIELVSSEETVKRPALKTDLKTVLFDESEAEQYYHKLFENKAITVKNSNGKDISFLLNQENTAGCAVNKTKSIVLELKDPLDSGFAILKMSGSDEALLEVQARSVDGEWKRIFAGESNSGSVSFHFENPGTTEIRISGLINAPALIKSVKVSEREEW